MTTLPTRKTTEPAGGCNNQPRRVCETCGGWVKLVSARWPSRVILANDRPTWHYNVGPRVRFGQLVTQYVYKEVRDDVRGCAETCRIVRFARERSATQLIFPLRPGK